MPNSRKESLMNTYYEIMDDSTYAKITVRKENDKLYATFEWPTGMVSKLTVNEEFNLLYTHNGKKAKPDLFVISDALRCWRDAGLWCDEGIITKGFIK